MPDIVKNDKHDDARFVTRQEFGQLPHIPAVDRVFDAMLGEIAA